MPVEYTVANVIDITVSIGQYLAFIVTCIYNSRLSCKECFADTIDCHGYMRKAPLIDALNLSS